ncbi:MAG TPA: YgaP-like transmembrane domain [Acidiferrobacterales bacterium]|jgi:hypothetical protein
MTERAFHLLFGSLLLIALAFELEIVVYGLIGWQVLEAVTNRFLTTTVSRLRYGARYVEATDCPACISVFQMGADRALRVVLAALLLLSYVSFADQLWIVSWFVGFALIAAGLSGICPMRLALKKLGFQ